MLCSQPGFDPVLARLQIIGDQIPDDLLPVQLHPPHAAADMLRIVNRDLEGRVPVSPPDSESVPGRGDDRRDLETMIRGTDA